jgi:polysaccharide pyruvyl transferase WcaK-like protein
MVADTKKRILILAGDSDGNIGDRAIVNAMCLELRRICPGANIYLLSNNPSRDEAYFKSVAIPRGLLGMPALIAVARNCDLILIGGGGLFQDDDSMVKMPYWALRIAMLKIIAHKTPIIGYSIGAGPLQKPISRMFARLAFACMDVVSVRDALAKETVDPLTAKFVHLVPDPALLLKPIPKARALELQMKNDVPVHEGPIIGVALRKWFHQEGSIIPHKFAVQYRLRKIPGQARCDQLAELVSEVLDRLAFTHNAFIVFMPTYSVAHEADDQFCRQIMNRMKSDNKRLLRITDPSEYKGIAGCMDVMLGGRMHPTIFSVAAGTKIVGLSYNQKFEGFFKLLDLSDNVMPIERFVDQKQSDLLFDLLSDNITNVSDITIKVRSVASRTLRFNEEIIAPLIA